MLAFVDLSTLNDRLGATRIISKQYRSTLFPDSEAHGGMEWRECSFIARDRAPDGRLAHVLFTTQGIHETEARELEAAGGQ